MSCRPALGLVLILAACTTQQAALPGPAATPTPDTAAMAQRGRALFLDKGCATCHLNGRAEAATFSVQQGPVLSNYRGDPDFLRRWLADPQAVRPAAQMPDLELSSAEIEDLVAFLIRE